MEFLPGTIVARRSQTGGTRSFQTMVATGHRRSGQHTKGETIVFRGWAGHAELDLYSDDRSSKADQLRHQPKAELCWLLPKARHQYRLRGTIRMLSPASAAPACRTAWESMSAGGRALWFWPSPGDPLQDERESDFPLEVEPDRDLPPHFLILRLDIDQVELLDLSRNPHRRLRWIRQDSWQETRINP